MTLNMVISKPNESIRQTWNKRHKPNIMCGLKEFGYNSTCFMAKHPSYSVKRCGKSNRVVESDETPRNTYKRESESRFNHLVPL